MRLFLAIELPDDVRAHLAGWCDQGVPLFNRYLDERQIDARLAGVAAENLHVTLKFLGEVDESAVADLSQALARVDAGRAAPLRAGHPELLPPRGPVRVVAAGLDGDVGRLAQLHRGVEDACASWGIAPERRPFLPHITVARAREPVPGERRPQLVDSLESYFPSPDFAAEGFTLFESRLGGGPPTYVPLVRFRG
jgi:2'-5' RNA ligase